MIDIGFSMHPLWLGGTTLEQFFSPLQANGLTAVEFELDPRQEEWQGFPQLIRDCAGRRLRLSFHAPYRAPYTLEGFSQQPNEIKARYSKMLYLAEVYSNYNPGRTVCVIHGASSYHLPAERLYADTLEFLKWGLDEFPHLTFALENNAPAKDDKQLKFGAERQPVLEVVKAIASERLGICWDLGHDGLHHRQDPPPADWLKQVIHVHVHDIAEDGLDHYPLIYNRVPYRDWLPLLKDCDTELTAVLELKGSQLTGWPPEQIHTALVKSIQVLKTTVSGS